MLEDYLRRQERYILFIQEDEHSHNRHPAQLEALHQCGDDRAGHGHGDEERDNDDKHYKATVETRNGGGI